MYQVNSSFISFAPFSRHLYQKKSEFYDLNYLRQNLGYSMIKDQTFTYVGYSSFEWQSRSYFDLSVWIDCY